MKVALERMIDCYGITALNLLALPFIQLVGQTYRALKVRHFLKLVFANSQMADTSELAPHRYVT